MDRYRLSVDAKEDLIRIHQYGVRKFGERQADAYFANFFNQFEIIAEQPLAFEAVPHVRPGYRRCVCGSDVIYYRLSKDRVVDIMAIMGRQDSEEF